MLLGELVETVGYHLLHHRFERIVGAALDLQQQTFLQCVGSYAGRVEGLQYAHHAVYIVDGAVDAVIDGKLVGYRLAVLAQQSVAVERPYDILHYLRVLLRQLRLAHLLLQLVVERRCVAIHHLLIVGRVGTRAARISCRRHVVVASADALKGIGKSRIALLAFVACVKVVVVGSALATRRGLRIVAIRGCRVATFYVATLENVFRRSGFESRVVVKFGVDALLEFGQGHLKQVHL